MMRETLERDLIPASGLNVRFLALPESLKDKESCGQVSGLDAAPRQPVAGGPWRGETGRADACQLAVGPANVCCRW